MTKTARYLLDTHIFLWLMLANVALKKRNTLEKAALTGGLMVSSMTCWEIGMLAARGRVHLGMPASEWVEQALLAPGVCLFELSPRAAVEASYLPGTFHGDPVDRILVAAARANNLILATRDEKILTYSQEGFVQAIAC